jgi:uncharacterized protein YxjI
MKKKCFALFLILGILTTSFLRSEIILRPEHFTVSQRWLSWTSDYDIETKEFKLGYVHRKLFSLGIEYDFYNVYDELEAKANMRWLSWGATFDVVDTLSILTCTIRSKLILVCLFSSWHFSPILNNGSA